MNPLLWTGAVAFFTALILTPITRNIFCFLGFVDHPDHTRKFHQAPIPRVGGIVIAFSYFGAFLVAPQLGILLSEENLHLVWRILPAAGTVFFVGLLDDLFGLKPWQKLLGQFLGANLAYLAGIHVSSLIGFTTESWWSYFLTIAWIVGCTNAFNLIDGMDGLAAGIGLISTVTIFIAGWMNQNPALAFAAFPLACCLLGFLRYNFNPATIFLGDSGSLLIGFLLGCFGLVWSHKSVTALGMTAPLMAIAIPLLDTLLCIVRRALKCRSVFSADRGHIHHKLLDRGLTARQVVLFVYALSALAAVFSLIQSTIEDDKVGGAIILAFCGVLAIGVQCLGYAEFTVAGKMLFSREFPRTLTTRVELLAFGSAIARAESIPECWGLLRATAEHCGVRCERLVVAPGVYFQAESRSISRDPEWSLSVPILEHGLVQLYGPLRSAPSSTAIGSFVDVLHEKLAPQLDRLLSETSFEPSATISQNIESVA